MNAFMPREYSSPSASTSVRIAARATRLPGQMRLRVTSNWSTRRAIAGRLPPHQRWQNPHSPNLQRHGNWAGLRIDDHAAIHRYDRLWKDDGVSFIILVLDGLVDELLTGSFCGVLDEKLQRSALVGRYAKLVNFPLERCFANGRGSSFGRRQDACDDEIRVHRFIDDNACRACFGNVSGQVFEQRFQVCVVRRHRHMRSVRIARQSFRASTSSPSEPN